MKNPHPIRSRYPIFRTLTDPSLTIALRIVGRGELVGDLILRAEADYLLACKVCSVVGDNVVGVFEATHDVLLKQLDNLLSSDFG